MNIGQDRPLELHDYSIAIYRFLIMLFVYMSLNYS